MPAIHRLPVPEPLRQIPPRAPGPGPEKDPVHHQPVIIPPVTLTRMSRKQRLQPGPLRIRQVMPLQPLIVHSTTQAETTAKIYETRSSRPADLGRRRVGMHPGVKRLAAGPSGRAAGFLPGTVPRAGRVRPGCLRGTRYRRCPVGAAPLRRRLVRGGQTPPRRRPQRAVSAPPAADGAGAVVSRHVPPGRAGAADPGGPRLPAAAGPPEPGPALSGWAGPFG